MREALGICQGLGADWSFSLLESLGLWVLSEGWKSEGKDWGWEDAPRATQAGSQGHPVPPPVYLVPAPSPHMPPSQLAVKVCNSRFQAHNLICRPGP